MTVGAQGVYAFLLTAAAPACTYSLTVTAPAGYVAPSTLIAADPVVFTPPTGAGSFKVQAQVDAPQPGAPTTYYLSFNLASGRQDVLHNHIPVDPVVASKLFAEKSVDRSTAEIGDSLTYTVKVKNAAGPDLPLITVVDSLPAGFRYLPGTARVLLPGASTPVLLADPAGGVGPRLVFKPTGMFRSDQTVTVSYRVRVGVGAAEGDGINRARGQSGVVLSNEARAVVKVSGGVFTTEACIVGKVFADCNGNRVQDEGEPGVGGVRLYLEDGTYFVTDSQGKYSYCGLKPITHVIKVDETTLPEQARLGIVDNRNAGDPGSRFIDLRNGELHRADFLIKACTPAVLDRIKSRVRTDPPDAAPPKAAPAKVFDSRRQQKKKESTDEAR
jgi:large repetitive protein